jgi:hypothetical protein
VRNDDNGQEHTEAPPVRRCGYCGEPLLHQRRGAKFCSREHKELARQRRQRAGEALTRLRGRHPLADSADLREFSDEIDLDDQDEDGHQDEDQGIVAGDSAPDPWAERNAAFRERMQITEAAEEIRARYEHLLEPFRQSLKRNPGVRPVAMARLEQERDEKIRELRIRQQRAEALETAARMAPQRAVQAAERQLEQAALHAFGRDLPGGSRRYQAPQWSGRPTDDIAVW